VLLEQQVLQDWVLRELQVLLVLKEHLVVLQVLRDKQVFLVILVLLVLKVLEEVLVVLLDPKVL
jgi:hypothetical protein